MSQFDTLIKGGTVIDGTGAADVALANGRIMAIGHHSGTATQPIDADGRLVTPGGVDIHTHYDGQVTWDPVLAQSLWHGMAWRDDGRHGQLRRGLRPCATGSSRVVDRPHGRR